VRSLSRQRDLADKLMLATLDGVHLPAKETAMLHYARKLTVQPWSVTPMDITDLRACGFSDAAIVDIALNTALFAAWNRIVDGLGGTLHSPLLDEAERLHLPQAWAVSGGGHNGHDDGPEEGGSLATIG
jgi:hypothetical protein